MNKIDIKNSLLILLIVFMSVTTFAYSSLSEALAITSNVKFRTYADIRVTDIKLKESNGGLENYSPLFSVNTTTNGITLPTNESTISYEVTVKNFGDIDQTIYGIGIDTTNNENTEYEISGYNLKDIIKFKESVTFTLKFKTKSGSNLVNNIKLKYDFRKVYTIDYDTNGGNENISSQRKYEGEDITLTNEIPTQSGYNFLGWTENKTANIQTYDKGSTFMEDKSTVLYAVWSLNSYNLTVNPNNGEEASVYTLKYKENKTIINPSKKGYTFTGWTVSGLGSTMNETTFTMGIEDASIKANYEVNKYIVTLDNQEATTSGSTSVEVTYGNAMPVIVIPTKTGYTFGGYYTEKNGSGTEYYKVDGTSSKNYDIASNTTLYAKWTINQYKLTVNPNGGTWSGSTSAQTFTQNYGTTKSIANPTGTPSYTISYNGNSGTPKVSSTTATRGFSKWTLSGSGSISGTTYTYGAGAGTLTAGYNATANSMTTTTATRAYTITYNTNSTGATSGSTTGTVNYTMNGWYTAASGGTKRATNGGSYAPTQSETLYAQWSAGTTTLASITKTGYTCKWNTNSGGTGTSYTSGQTGYTTGSNVTLYASCTVNPYVLTVNPNGGTWSGSTSGQTFTQNYGTTKSIAVPTRTGYTFNGWTLSGSGSKTSTTPVSTSSQTYTYGAGAGTLTASWIGNKYTVTLNNQSATTAGTTSTTATYGSAMPTITVPSRTGYTFGGYYTSTGGSGTQYYTAGGTSAKNYSIVGATTLYAKWTVNSYTVTFNANGGSVTTASKSVTYASTYGTLPTPTRTNYVFNGWYTASSGGSKITSSTTVSITSNQTLYAQWSSAVAKNVIGSTTTYYTSLSGALNGASTTTATTTTLLKNTSEAVWIENASKNTTLNLGGYTITGSLINNNTSSTITVKNGTVTTSSDRVLYNTGIMTIESGTYTSSYAGFTEVIWNTSKGTLNINGGTFTNTGTAHGTINNSGICSINGGTISSPTGWTVSNTGTYYMSSGTINLTTNGSDGTALYNDTDGTMDIKGGNIYSGGYGVVNSSGKSANIANLTISINYSNGKGNVLNRENSTTILDNVTLSNSSVNFFLYNLSGVIATSFMKYGDINHSINGIVYCLSKLSTGLFEIEVFGRTDAISYPTWTELNGQDDIKWGVSSTFSSGFGTYQYYRIYASEHNNELGKYFTHVYSGSTFLWAFTYTMS